MTRKLIAGNWKMNGSLAANAALLDALSQGLAAAPAACDVARLRPAPYLAQVLAMRSAQAGLAAIDLGAQDCFGAGARAPTPVRCRRHAQGVRLPLCHRRPFGAPPVPR